MIRASFREPLGDPNWARWRTKAERATGLVKERLEQHAAIDIRDELYKEPREVFLDAFHGKCAYCEAKVTAHQRRGDVEHFRPKGRVTDRNNVPVNLPSAEGEPPRQHPGYPWLAYDWRNLLPSCISCNQLRSTRDGRLFGKGGRFPVEGFRASVPGDEVNERPLLLHPLFDNPDEHLTYNAESGCVVGVTPRGEATVDVLDLNRDALMEERKQVYDLVLATVVGARTYLELKDFTKARRTLAALERYKTGAATYSLAGRAALAASQRDP